MTTRPAGETRRKPDPVRVQHVLQSLVEIRGIPACSVRVGLLQDFGDVVLFPEEAAAVHRAAPARLATFRAGRGCARAALTDLGATEFAIAIASSGAPVWPEGFVGSIAHTNEIAAAVVARSAGEEALGLDIETDTPLDDATMVQIVCRPEELLAGSHAGARANLQRGKFIFVMKEAAYKLYSPLTGAFLEFHDVSVSFDEDAGTFRAEIVNPEQPSVAGARVVAGVFAKTENFVVALASLR